MQARVFFRDEPGMHASDDEMRFLFLFAHWRRNGVSLHYLAWSEIKTVDWQPDHVVIQAPPALVEATQQLVRDWRDDYDVRRYAMLFTQIGWMRERPRSYDPNGRLVPRPVEYLRPSRTLANMPQVFAPGLAVLPRLTTVEQLD